MRHSHQGSSVSFHTIVPGQDGRDTVITRLAIESEGARDPRRTAIGEDASRWIAPRIRPGSIEKTGVMGRLAGSAGPFATIIAPAGYGKTTLLAQWSAIESRPFAWIAADRRDDDTVVFLRDIAAAIHHIEPIPAAVFDALSGPGDSVWARLAVLGNALAALRGPTVVVIDDLHEISNPICFEMLAGLLGYVQPGSKLVVASREEPALPLARWRAEGLVVEIETADLRLDREEARRLIAGAGVSLDDADVAELTERTEGWPAALYLAALSLRSGAATPRRAERFEDGDRYVAEYLRVEVLSRLEEAEARFLVRTSMLEQMSGALCDAVLQTSGSASLLGSIERSNRFVIALDHRSEWFRYHHLFRELLRGELAGTDPESIPGLNRRAMTWCIANDDLEAAVRYGHAAGEVAVVAGLVDRLVSALYYDGRIETLEEWFGWFSDAELEQFPALALDRAWLEAMTGRAADAELHASLADGAGAGPLGSVDDSALSPRVFLLRAMMMPNGPEQAISDADTALAQLPPRDPGVPTARLLRGVALSLLGSPVDAIADLLAAAELGRALGGRDPVFIAQAELALIEARRGAWNGAARYAGSALALVGESSLDRHPPTALVHAAALRIAIHERRLADAHAAMTRIHSLRPHLDRSLPWLTVQVGLELTRAQLALGQVDEARLSLEHIATVLARRPELGSLVADERELNDHTASASGAKDGWSVNLTAAELRLLPYLATHLTFPEIAAELFVTRHTVRSQAKAIYAKFEATSRSQAIERAVQIGLLESILPYLAGVAV